MLLWVSTLLLLTGCPEPGADDTKKEAGIDTETEVTTDPENHDGTEMDTADTEVYLDTVDTAEDDTASDSDPDSESETTSEEDQCPDDPQKTQPGQCGCGNSEADSDGDGTANCVDICPSDPNKTDLGQCGCGVRDSDSDGDGTANCNDYCPKDPDKRRPGICGCGRSDADNDGDGVPDCNDKCPDDPMKTEPGACGCGVVDRDSDEDGIAECNELPLEYVEGLERTHLLATDDKDAFDTEVCKELTDRWFNDSYLRIRERSFGFAYYVGETPCEEIGPFDRWMSIFEGYLLLTLVDVAQLVHSVEFVADVNDGVRLVVRDPETKEEICRMELWQDVPEYDNYHSTDGYHPVNYGCETLLTAGVYYPMKLEVYHQGDANSSNSLFNRAYLDMFYWGLPSGASITFYHGEVGLPVTSD